MLKTVFGACRLPLAIAISWSVCSDHCQARTWKDNTGKHQVEAELVRVNLDQVTLRKSDGEQKEVPIARLGDPEKQFVRKWVSEQVAKSVGKIGPVSKALHPSWVVVFTETHTSRLGQLEIALMLHRLHRDFGLRHIALEGYVQGAIADASWFHRLPDDPGARRRVAIRLLADGEISAAEFLALLFPDITLHPVEDAKLYAIEPNENAGDEIKENLQALLMKSAMMPEHQRQLMALSQDEQLDYLLSEAEPAVGRMMKMYERVANGEVVQAEEWVSNLLDFEKRLQAVGINNVDGLRGMRAFFETAIDRSTTMAQISAQESKKSGNTPLALIAGAAHTNSLISDFDSLGASYVVVEPASLGQGEQKSDLTIEAFERKGKKLSVDDDQGLGAMLDGRKKPQPVISEAWFRAEAELRLLCDKVTMAGSTPKPPLAPPFDLSSDDVTRSLVRIEPASIRRIDDEFIFKATLFPGDSAKTRDLWVRAALVAEPVAEEEDIETALLALIDDVKVEERRNQVTADATPVVNVTSTVAAYFSAKEEVVTSARVRDHI